jgi:hypothetical protein
MQEKDNLIQELLSLPNLIEEIELDILEKNKTLQEINDSITDIEAEIKSSINSAQDEGGKKLYSNDQSRQLAFINDSKEDSILVGLYLRKNQIALAISISRIKIDKLSNHQRNIRAVINYIN